MNHPPPTPPRLLGRTDEELQWWRRRSLLQAAATWLAAGGWVAARAQPGRPIVELRGEVLRNGQALATDDRIEAGDRIETGPGATAVFAVGQSAFMVRQNTRVALEGDTPTAVKALRLLTGAVASVWGRAPTARSSCPPPRRGFAAPGCMPRCSPNRTFAAISATATAPWNWPQAAKGW